jgi:uracil-DNA glycosylase
MSDFSEAFDYVRATLHSWQENGNNLRAARAAVERLQAGGRIAANPNVVLTVPKAEAVLPIEIMETAKSASVLETPRIAPATGSKAERIRAMRGPVLACTKCPNLARFRSQVVFGVGNADAELMFVGEAPGEDEDKQGEPFVGKAGQLLTKIIETMGLTRDAVYIANVLKCRPDMPPGVPGNRKPELKEMQTCLPYLREQIEIIQPKVVVALGATALYGLTGQNTPVGKVRGKWLEFQGIPLMVTFHPAYLLRNQAPSEKRKVWEDMLLVLEKLGHPITGKQRQYFTRT